MTLSRSLSSAPPITMTGPAPPIARTLEIMKGSVPTGSVLPADAPRRIAGRAKDQAIVRLDDVDRALEPALDVEREPGSVLDDDVVGSGFIGELEADAGGGVVQQPHTGVGVQPAGGGGGAREDLRCPLREL